MADKHGLLSEETEEQIRASDDKWDELLARPEAKRLLRQMAREALEDCHAGRTTDITITEDGEPSEAFQTVLASEAVLRRNWDRPEEDEAWANL